MPDIASPLVSQLHSTTSLFTYTGKGLTSRQEVRVEVKHGQPGKGIVFYVRNPRNESEHVELPARAEFVANTLRNVTLGRDGVRLSIVEHFLAAVSLWGLEDLCVFVDGPEMPLGDGSANFWIELLRKSVPLNTQHLQGIDIREPITLSKNDRSLIMVPDVSFSVTYLMDLKHPQIGRRWQTWNLSMPATDIADARTFGALKEHEMLGLVDDVVSLTPDGFTHKLRFEDEPVRHKLLDLIGDLALVGFNPLRLNARFISIKGGHEMDVQLATKLAQVCKR